MKGTKIDFFIPLCTTPDITAEQFGICDKAGGSPAFVSFNKEEEWIAEVINKTGRSLNFTAIDNCIIIKRDDGDDANRCDGMLYGPEHLIFIELKDQRADWIRHAVEEQLLPTIEAFKKNHEMLIGIKRMAYACNRRHPRFQYSQKELMNSFRHRTGFRLNLVNTIIVK